MFPHLRLERARIVEVHAAADAGWLGRSVADVVAERGGHPSDVLADLVLANDCHPGIVAVGISNADVDGLARTFADPYVLVSSSDSGAHVQMLCASGDTTLYLTRHVRDRSDVSLEHGVWQLTGRQAEVFGIHDRGTIAVGQAGDLAVFALDELHWDDDEFVADLPGGALRMRRPDGGFRATIVNGEVVQLAGHRHRGAPGSHARRARLSDRIICSPSPHNPWGGPWTPTSSACKARTRSSSAAASAWAARPHCCWRVPERASRWPTSISRERSRCRPSARRTASPPRRSPRT